MNEGPNATADDIAREYEVGDAACWLHLICPACGAVIANDDGHRSDCDAGGQDVPSNKSF